MLLVLGMLSPCGASLILVRKPLISLAAELSVLFVCMYDDGAKFLLALQSSNLRVYVWKSSDMSDQCWQSYHEIDADSEE